MSTPAQKQLVEGRSLDAIKILIDEHTREREGLRAMEWKTFFQFYVGCAAVVTAHFKICELAAEHESMRFYRGFALPGAVAVAMVGLLALSELRLLSAVHDRMRHAADRKLMYMEMIRDAFQIPGDLGERGERLYGRRWAVLPQYWLMSATASLLACYFVWRGWPEWFLLYLQEISLGYWIGFLTIGALLAWLIWFHWPMWSTRWEQNWSKWVVYCQSKRKRVVP